jgi:uncharacterized membrane protein
MNQHIKQEGKVMAIVSYITIIGLAIAYFTNRDKGNEFVNFHIWQSFRITILGIIISVIVAVLFTITGIQFLSYLNYIPFVLMAIGAINANELKLEKLPFIGNLG